MFSDESRLTLDFLDRRRRAWYQNGEHYTDPARVGHDWYGGGSVMVWGVISMTGKTDLHVCQGRVTGVYYRDNVLAPYLIPSAKRHGPRFIFKDDNARAHRARVVTDYLQRRNIRTLLWPAMSSDLSPIKYVWDIIGKRVPRHITQLRRCSSARGIGKNSSDNYSLTYWEHASLLYCLLW